MVKIHKLLINVVNDNKPKMLIGLAKMASGQVRRLYVPPSQYVAPPPKWQDLNDSLSGKMWNAVSPLTRPPRRGPFAALVG